MLEHAGGERPKLWNESGSYPWPRSTSPMDTVRTEVMEYLQQPETPSDIRRPRNEDTDKKSPPRKRTVALPRSVTGDNIGEPERCIPENLEDIPSFLTWLANFQTELDNVKEKARRHLMREGGSTTQKRARKRQADAEITRRRREVERQQRSQTQKKDQDGKNRGKEVKDSGIFLQ